MLKATIQGYNLKIQTENFEAGIAQAIKKAALDILAKAKQAAPVDTGALKGSIRTEFTDFGYTATIQPNVDYAAYVEYGTIKMKAQPYLIPAFEQVYPEFLKVVGKEIDSHD